MENKKKKIGNFQNNILFIGMFLLIVNVFSINLNKPLLFNSIYFYFFIVVLIFVGCIKRKDIFNLNIIKIQFIVFTCIILISALRADNSISLKFFIYYIIGIIIFLVLSENNKWYEFSNKLFKIISILFSIATIFSIIFPNIYFNIVHKLFSMEQQKIIFELYSYDLYSGIAGQTGSNAFFISIGIAILFCEIFLKKKYRKINCLFLLISFIALLLTGKRGLLLANLITMIIILYFIFIRKRKKGIGKFLIIIITIIIIILIMITIFPKTAIVFDRFLSKEDKLTGRYELYNTAIVLFKEKPILGNGINTFKLLNINNNLLDTHNVYLQLLCEIGIIGVILFIISTISIYIRSIRVFDKNIKSNIYLGNIIISLYIQNIFIIYCMSGNPFYDYNMLYTYFIFISIPVYGHLKNTKL
ncbi:O-antigen ligase family protein [Clostridium perfringens]